MATILHIDQDEASQRFIQSALGQQHNVVIAADGPMAVQYCAMIQPDLILMNFASPDIDGRELASRLKMFMPQTPILIITGNHLNRDKVQTLVNGYDGLLTEPIDVEQLRQRVQSLLPPPQLPEFASSLPGQAVQQFETQIAALNRANRRLASLNAISALIGTSLDLEHLTDEILSQIHKNVNFDSATLLLLKGDILEAAASRGFTEYRRGMNVYSRNEHNSAWQVVSHKLPLIIKDVTESEYWEPRPELSRIRSWLGVPLIYKDRVVGVLTLDNNEVNAFSDADARYVFTLAYQIAIAVENTQLFEEWEEQATRLKLINEVAQEINTLLDVDYLFEALAKAIFERLHYERVAILEVDETRSLLTLKAIYGEYPPQLEVGVYQQDINEGLIGKAIQTDQPILINDVLQSSDILLFDDSEVGSALVVPIFVGTQVEAIITVERNEVNGFSDQDLWTLSSLASQAATAIKNTWLYRGLDTYSDSLERTIAARTQRLQAIKKISQVVSQGLDLDELLAVVGQDIGQIFSPETTNDVQVTIGLVDGADVVLRKIYGLAEAGQHPHAKKVAAPVENLLVDEPHPRLKFKIDPQKLTGQVIIQAKPKILHNISAQDVYHPVSGLEAKIIKSLLMAPLITGGKTLGLIIVESQEADAFDDGDLETLETLAFQVASAIEHARLLKKTREIAIVEERTRLARDMHDGVAQNLAYLHIQVDRCLNMVEEGGKLELQLEQISALLKENIDEIRRNIFDLRPVDLEGKSLFEVLENFVAEFGRRWNLKTTCTITGQTIEVSPEVESSLYRILQEALSNARQHAHCTELSVNLAIEDHQWVTLDVKDDGCGFDATRLGQAKHTGLGLISMRERAESVGGQLSVASLPGEGTRIFAMLPLDVKTTNGSKR